ncbi:MAG: glutamate 5-kinase [Pseudomonadota bacterium]|nr:glutamate 5-kinase [Pseudomonadota bacterium]
MANTEQKFKKDGAFLAQSKRVVVKLGSSLLIDSSNRSLNIEWLESFASELAALKRAGQEILLVSSGAIALGRVYLGLNENQRLLEEHQAAAAAGQILLAHAYQELMEKHDCKVAQVLLTPDDTENRQRYLNARNTIQTLLNLGVLPVINENDTVATEEIRYGDNDRLAARVAQMVSADCLVLLSDVAGMFNGDPNENNQLELISQVTEITPELESLAGSTKTAYGSGGMATKLSAARICMSAGCATVIASGKTNHPLTQIISGVPCTWFLPSSSPLAARKQWIAGSLKPCGKLIIDDGAKEALANGNSLLPVGVKEIFGEFQCGDPVVLLSIDGRDIGRGLVSFSSEDAMRIIGRRSEEIEMIIGYESGIEMIHRDNLVINDIN